MVNNPFNWKIGDIVVITRRIGCPLGPWGMGCCATVINIDELYSDAPYHLRWSSLKDEGHWTNSFLERYGVVAITTELEKLLYGVK